MLQEEAELGFPKWKWQVLRFRRRNIFMFMNLSLLLIWISIFSNLKTNARNSHQVRFKKETLEILSSGSSAVMCLHGIILVLSLSDARLHQIVENSFAMGKGLVNTMITSMFVVFLFNSLRLYASSVEFALSGTAFTLLIPRLLHNMGYSMGPTYACSAVFGIPWLVFWVRGGYAGFTLICWVSFASALVVSLLDIYFQEYEYVQLFHNFQSTVFNDKGGKTAQVSDISATFQAAVGMVSQLEYDIRSRVSKCLEFFRTDDPINVLLEREKCLKTPGHDMAILATVKTKANTNSKPGLNALKQHHVGHLYHIEMLGDAASMSLKDNKISKERRDISFGDENGSFYLSEMVENIFRAFDDSLLPRASPLFLDASLGDLYFKEVSRKCLETILYLIVYDSIYGRSACFCTISFKYEQNDQDSRVVELLITTCSNSCLVEHTSESSFVKGPKRLPTNSGDSMLSASDVKPFKQCDMPQIVLADRLAKKYLSTRVFGYEAKRDGNITKKTWGIDMSAAISQRYDEKKSTISDSEKYLYEWKLYQDTTRASDQRVYQEFKQTLNALGVTFIVGDSRGANHLVSRMKRKFLVIHERILKQLDNSQLTLIAAEAANIIVLEDKVVNSRRISSTSEVNVSTSIESDIQDFPDEVRLLIRCQIYSNVTPDGLMKRFKEMKLLPKHMKYAEELRGVPDKPFVLKSFSKVLSESGLRSVGTTTPLSSCWRQMLHEWKVDPNGFLWLQRAMQHMTGTDKGVKNGDISPITERFDELYLHECGLLHIEERLLELQDHACLTLTNINELLSSSSLYVSSHRRESEQADKFHVSLLEVVCSAKYGTSGGGSVTLYILAKYISPLYMIKASIQFLLSHSFRSTEGAEEPLQGFSITRIKENILMLIDQSFADKLVFLQMWFEIVAIMLARLSAADFAASAPRLLDIAENALWGLSDCFGFVTKEGQDE